MNVTINLRDDQPELLRRLKEVRRTWNSNQIIREALYIYAEKNFARVCTFMYSEQTRKERQMNLEVFKFADAELKVICEQPDKILLVMKPICDALSLDWHSQHRNISDDPVLNSVVRKIRTTGADGKNYEMVCIPLDYLNGWLFKISANRYKGERRELIIRYQKECYRTLAERFGLSSQSPVGFKSTTRLQFQAAVEQYAMRDTERKNRKDTEKGQKLGDYRRERVHRPRKNRIVTIACRL